MRERRHALHWLPPFLVGLAAAAAAEIAVGLLLYAGPGLMRSLTTVLSVEAAALGVGLATAPRSGPGLVDALRRRWLLALVTFLSATAFTAAWSLVEGIGSSALTQGLGLAVLAALPLYAAGTVLGGMGGGGGAGAASALGAAVGFAATGLSLPQVVTPASLLLACLILLSAGAMIHGAVLDAGVRVREVDRMDSPLGPVTVEDRLPLSGEGGVRVLSEGGRVRAWWNIQGSDSTPWEVAALSLCAALRGPPHKVLVVGGGASALASREGSAAAEPRPDIEILERNVGVAALAERHRPGGDDGHTPAPEPARTRVGELSDLLSASVGPYDAVLVEAAGVTGGTGPADLAEETLVRVRELTGDRGVLAWMGLPPSVSLPGWSVARYVRHGDSVDALLPELDGPGAQELLVAVREGDVRFPDDAHGFVRVRGPERAPP